jgi:hypothetical protein
MELVTDGTLSTLRCVLWRRTPLGALCPDATWSSDSAGSSDDTISEISASGRLDQLFASLSVRGPSLSSSFVQHEFSRAASINSQSANPTKCVTRFNQFDRVRQAHLDRVALGEALCFVSERLVCDRESLQADESRGSAPLPPSRERLCISELSASRRLSSVLPASSKVQLPLSRCNQSSCGPRCSLSHIIHSPTSIVGGGLYSHRMFSSRSQSNSEMACVSEYHSLVRKRWFGGRAKSLFLAESYYALLCENGLVGVSLLAFSETHLAMRSDENALADMVSKSQSLRLIQPLTCNIYPSYVYILHF